MGVGSVFDRGGAEVRTVTAKKVVGADPSSWAPPSVGVPGGDAELRHGWRLSRVNGLAVFVITRDVWWAYRMSFDDRLEIAWSAMMERVCLSDDPPSARDLQVAASAAIQRQVQADDAAHGTGNTMNPLVAVPGLNFARYWWRREERDFAELLIDQLAARQIVEALTPRDREVVGAFMDADCDTEVAAVELGVTGGQFRRLLKEARLRFLECWHEGETPSRIWMKDGPSITTMALMATLRRRKRQALAAAQAKGEREDGAN